MTNFRQKFADLFDPRDMAATTAPFDFILLLFGQLPYKIIKSPETNLYECRTSTLGVCLCIGHLLAYIISFADYRIDEVEVGQFIETTIAIYDLEGKIKGYGIMTVCNFIVVLLKWNIFRKYAHLLNKLDTTYNVSRRKPCLRKMYCIIVAKTAFFWLLIIIAAIVFDGMYRRSDAITENSSFSTVFVRSMPVIFAENSISSRDQPCSSLCTLLLDQQSTE